MGSSDRSGIRLPTPPPRRKPKWKRWWPAAREPIFLPRRDHLFARLARRWGLEFLPEYPPDDPYRIWELPFDWATAPAAVSNVLTGSHRGTNVVAFDFASGIGPGGYGGAPTAVDASCAFTVLPASFPPLTILPRASQSHLGRWVVGRVRFERRFDRLFRIKTKDRGFARLVLSEEMRELLLGPDGDARWLHPSEGGVVAFEIRERWIACTAPLLEPPNIRRNLLEPLATFTENIRGRVLRSYPVRNV